LGSKKCPQKIIDKKLWKKVQKSEKLIICKVFFLYLFPGTFFEFLLALSENFNAYALSSTFSGILQKIKAYCFFPKAITRKSEKLKLILNADNCNVATKNNRHKQCHSSMEKLSCAPQVLGT
jgi:hypothetical protein